MGFVACLLAAPLAAQAPPVNLPFTNTSSSWAVAADDVVHVIKSDSSFLVPVQYSRSTDRGRTWSSPTTLFPFAAAFRASGTHVYVLQLGSSVACASSQDAGLTWGSPVAVPGSAGYGAELAVDGASAHLLLWSSTSLLHSRSLDGGVTWSTSPVPLVGATNNDRRIVTVNGAVHLAWLDTVGISVRSSLDNGVTWLPPYQVAGPAPGWWLSAVGTAVHVTAATSAGIEYNHSLDGGVTWLPTTTILGPVGATHASVADANHVYVAFGDSTGVSVAHSADQGSTWATTAVSPSSADPYTLTTASSGASVGVTWIGSQNLHAAMSLDAGATWSPTASWTWYSSSMGYNIVRSFAAMDVRGSRMYVAQSILQCFIFGGPVCLFSNGGIDATLDGGQTWFSRGNVLGEPEFVDLVDSLTVIAGSNPGPYYSVFTPTATLVYGHQPYGAGTRGSGQFTPALRATWEPLTGTTIQFALTQALGGSIAALAATFAGPAAIPLGSSTILLQPPVTPLYGFTSGTSGQPGAGTMTVSLAIPSSPQLIGTRLDLQGFVLDPGGADGFAASAGVETWVF
jgi:hypothetical protein